MPVLGLVDDRVADRARANDVAVHLHAVIEPSARASVERCIDSSGNVSGQLSLQWNLRGTRTTVIASMAAPRSFASAIAVATISSPMSPSFIGTRMRSNAAPAGRPLDRSDMLEQARFRVLLTAT